MAIIMTVFPVWLVSGIVSVVNTIIPKFFLSG